MGGRAAGELDMKQFHLNFCLFLLLLGTFIKEGKCALMLQVGPQCNESCVILLGEDSVPWAEAIK